MSNRDGLIAILQKWGESLKENGPTASGTTSAAVPIMQSCQLEGIWTLWSDAATQNYIKEYMLKTHPKLKNYTGHIVDSEQ